MRVAQASNDVSHLIQQLHDPDVQRRRDAARELSKIKPLPPAGIVAMANLLERQDQDGLIERIAYDALCNAGGAAVQAATRFAQSKDRFISQRGIGLLGCLAYGNKDVWPILIGIYKQNPAGNVIGELAAAGPLVLPVLLGALKGNDPTMRAGAIMTINRMVSNARMFSSADNAARNHFGIITPKDLAPARAELAAALQDPDPKIRSEAAIVLNYADPTDKRAIPILIGLLAEGDRQFIGSAISGIKAMGSAAKPAVPALEHALAADPDVTVRMDAAQALVQIEGPAACAPLEQAIVKDHDGRVGQIRTTLAIIPPCPHIIPTLMATLGDERLYDSQEIAALSRMGSSAVPELAAALKTSNLYVRQNSADALAGMKPLPPDAVRALQFALKDKNSDVRATAIASLRTAGGEAQQAAEAAEKRDQQATAEKPKLDTRLYSRKQISAPIPADDEYMYPLTLSYMVPITKGAAAEAKLFATLHAGKDRADRLVFWRKVGDDRYQQLRIMYSEEEYLGLGYHFEHPLTFTSAYERVSNAGSVQQNGFFVDIPLTGWRVKEDSVFVIENDQVVPVAIDSPYGGPGGGNNFEDGKLEYGENIYNRDDPTCCPTGGSITGTYKIVEDTRQNPAVWKIVVATTKRNPPASQ